MYEIEPSLKTSSSSIKFDFQKLGFYTVAIQETVSKKVLKVVFMDQQKLKAINSTRKISAKLLSEKGSDSIKIDQIKVNCNQDTILINISGLPQTLMEVDHLKAINIYRQNQVDNIAINKVFLQAGLDVVPLVLQDVKNGNILRIAGLKHDSWEQTLKHPEKHITFWSKQRKESWLQGEIRGDYLQLITASCNSIYNTLSFQVKMITGSSCHHINLATGKNYYSCYYRKIQE